MDLALRKQIQDWTVGDVAGQLLAFSSGTTFGFKSDGNSGELFANGAETWRLAVPRPLQVEAMILSPDALFAAGPVNRSQRRTQGGVLWAFSPETGEKLGEVPLDAPPVYDGLAAGDGRLYVATEDGRLTCLAGQ
jgi:outer membrane protein assembly factor BamB